MPTREELLAAADALDEHAQKLAGEPALRLRGVAKWLREQAELESNVRVD